MEFKELEGRIIYQEQIKKKADPFEQDISSCFFSFSILKTFFQYEKPNEN